VPAGRKYLGGLERRRGEELGDLGRELPVQIARTVTNPTHSVDRCQSELLAAGSSAPGRRAAVAFAGRLGFWGLS